MNQDFDCTDLQDSIIDPVQIELLEEEIKRDPENDDSFARELIKLYRFQQSLIRRWENGEFGD